MSDMFKQFEVGEVVFLKSGSPPLTVERVESHDFKPTTVHVTWHTFPDYYAHEAQFDARLLTRSPTPVGGVA